MTDEPKTRVPARRFQRRCTRSSSVIGRPRSLDLTRYTELAKYRYTPCAASTGIGSEAREGRI